MHERDDLDERQLFISQVPDFIRVDVPVHPAGTRNQNLPGERMRHHATEGVRKLLFEVLDVCRRLDCIPIDGTLNVTLGGSTNVDLVGQRPRRSRRL